MPQGRVTVTLTWAELRALRAVLRLDIERVERKIALGVADPEDFLGQMRRVKAKLDRPVERLMARAGI